MYILMLLYTLFSIIITVLFLNKTSNSLEFSLDRILYIFISLLIINLFLFISYLLKKDKNWKDYLKYLLHLFFIPCIFPVISILLFSLFYSNYFYALAVYIPIGIYSGMIYLIIDRFLMDKFDYKKLYTIKLVIIVPIFMAITFLFLLIRNGEIIKPLKNILNIESDS
jgi:lipopolysaccharide export LptBFGC system permease protein LptF